jgi:hypothetical protein
MSVIKVNNITNLDGTSGPVIAGITTVSSTSHLVVPTGRTGTRYADDGENIVRNGLVMYLDAKHSYPSRTGIGTTTSGAAATPGSSLEGEPYIWYDMSGFENNGQLLNQVGYSTANGGSLIFDGINDGVNCGNDSSITKLQQITINCWVKPISFPSGFNTGRVILRSESGYRIYWYESSGFSDPNRLYFYINATDNSLETSASYLTSNFSTNTWYNISATYDGSSTKLYVNSVLVDSKTGKSGFINSDDIIYLGRTGSNLYRYDGNISQVSIYNRALSESEVLQNYNALVGRYA